MADAELDKVLGKPARSAGTPLTPDDVVRLRALYWGFICVCLIFAGVGWYLLQWQSKPLHNWIPVSATVRRIDTMTQSDGHGHTTKRPIILYSYAVAGVVYTTDRVLPSTDPRDPSAIAALAATLREGQTVTAYYEPVQPESAYLIRARSRLLYACFGVPLALAFILMAYWPRVLRSA